MTMQKLEEFELTIAINGSSDVCVR